jgi:hypothetical protein
VARHNHRSILFSGCTQQRFCAPATGARRGERGWTSASRASRSFMNQDILLRSCTFYVAFVPPIEHPRSDDERWCLSAVASCQTLSSLFFSFPCRTDVCEGLFVREFDGAPRFLVLLHAAPALTNLVIRRPATHADIRHSQVSLQSVPRKEHDFWRGFPFPLLVARSLSTS